MLIGKNLEREMNKQIGRELGASNQYIAIASFFDGDNLPNLAAFFYRQADEEHMHAMKFVRYIVDTGGHVQIPVVLEPQSRFSSAEEAVSLALQWEVDVTDQINKLMALAIEETDYIAQDFLRWFETEQLEEVSSMEQLLSYVRRGKENLLFVDDYLGRNPIVVEGEEA